MSRIISVPHSGTRSLQKFIGLTAYWHWGLHDDAIWDYTELAHIPIRDPYDVYLSWISRYPNEPDKVATVLDLLGRQIEYTDGRKDTHFYVTEDLPVHLGQGPESKKMPRGHFNQLKRWIDDKMGFYERFYEGFEWLTK